MGWMRKKVLSLLVSRGVLIEPEALKLAIGTPDPDRLVESFLDSRGQKPLLVTADDLRCFMESAVACQETPPVSTEGAAASARAPGQEKKQATLDPAGPEVREPPPKPPEAAAARRVAGGPGLPANADAKVAREAVEGSPEPPKPRRAGMGDRIAAKNYDADIAVISEITDESRCTGQASDFKNYFEDRLRSIRRILRQRPEMGGAVEVEKALRVDRDVRLICIVSDVARPQDKHSRGAWVTMEDETGSLKVWLPDDGGFAEKYVLKDEVIGIVGKVVRPKNQGYGRDRGPYIVAERLVRPELAGPRTPRRSPNPLSIAFISDIHVGSKQFLGDDWKRMMGWLKKGEGEASRVKYVVVPGDLVDGIGVYPNQEEELDVDDIYLQYEALAKMLEEMPDHISLTLMPGNHDASRLSEPQPALPCEVRKILGTRPLYVGNPCYLAIEGVRVLAYHGRGFDDYAGNLGPIGYQQPLMIMQEMLRRRHMSPIYGGKNQIAPERRDYLVINPIPDIFVTGHVHGAGIQEHNGIVIVNASTWQSQTSFQRMHNFHPDPGKVPWVRLDSFMYGVENFH